MSDPERDARRSLVIGLMSLLALLLIIGLISLRHAAEMRDAAEWIHSRVGLAGLLAVLFFSDFLTSPIPPDLILVIMSKSPLHEHWPLLVGYASVQSVVAGSLGWWCGRRLGRARILGLLGERWRERMPALVRRYGAWAVAIGALTPVPFSFTCWTAGAMDMSYRRFLWPSLLRIPRFYGYYLLFAGADRLFERLV